MLSNQAQTLPRERDTDNGLQHTTVMNADEHEDCKHTRSWSCTRSQAKDRGGSSSDDSRPMTTLHTAVESLLLTDNSPRRSCTHV